jgi:hypothetical protein
MFRMRQGISMLKRTFTLMAITMAAFGESSFSSWSMNESASLSKPTSRWKDFV